MGHGRSRNASRAAIPGVRFCAVCSDTALSVGPDEALGQQTLEALPPLETPAGRRSPGEGLARGGSLGPDAAGITAGSTR